MCKKKFKDILFYAPNWSDEQGVRYGRFSGLLCPLSYSEEKSEFCLKRKIQEITANTAYYELHWAIASEEEKLIL